MWYAHGLDESAVFIQHVPVGEEDETGCAGGHLTCGIVEKGEEGKVGWEQDAEGPDLHLGLR